MYFLWKDGAAESAPGIGEQLSQPQRLDMIRLTLELPKGVQVYIRHILYHTNILKTISLSCLQISSVDL